MSKPDDDPKQAARAARVAADLKETEDLLAGFDRPGRTPRTPAVKRDFVDYHSKKARSDPEPDASDASTPLAGPARPKQAVSTFLIPREASRFPGWLPWAALLMAMPLGGGLLAYVLMHEGKAETSGSAPSLTTLPSAATTISAASAPTTRSTAAFDPGAPQSPASSAPSVIPSSEPPTPLAPAATTPRMTPSGSSQVTSPPSPAPSSSGDQRVDFMRKL